MKFFINASTERRILSPNRVVFSHQAFKIDRRTRLVDTIKRAKKEI
jgi:hypothetical protein